MKSQKRKSCCGFIACLYKVVAWLFLVGVANNLLAPPPPSAKMLIGSSFTATMGVATETTSLTVECHEAV